MEPRGKSADPSHRPIRLSIFPELIAPFSDYLRQQEAGAGGPNAEPATVEGLARLRRYLEESTKDPEFVNNRFLWIDPTNPSDLGLFEEYAEQFQQASDDLNLGAMARGFAVACKSLIAASALRRERDLREPAIEGGNESPATGPVGQSTITPALVPPEQYAPNSAPPVKLPGDAVAALESAGVAMATDAVTGDLALARNGIRLATIRSQPKRLEWHDPSVKELVKTLLIHAAQRQQHGTTIELSTVLHLADAARCTVDKRGGLIARNYYLSHPAFGEFVALDVPRGRSSIGDIRFASPQFVVAMTFLLSMEVELSRASGQGHKMPSSEAPPVVDANDALRRGGGGDLSAADEAKPDIRDTARDRLHCVVAPSTKLPARALPPGTSRGYVLACSPTWSMGTDSYVFPELLQAITVARALARVRYEGAPLDIEFLQNPPDGWTNEDLTLVAVYERLMKELDMRLPTDSGSLEPVWLMLTLKVPSAPIVSISRDPRAGDCLTPVFFVAGGETTIDQSPDWLMPIRRIAPLWHGVEARDGLQYGIIPSMFHMTDDETFTTQVTDALRQEEARSRVVWVMESCEVLIQHAGVSYTNDLGSDGRRQVTKS